MIKNRLDILVHQHLILLECKQVILGIASDKVRMCIVDKQGSLEHQESPDCGDPYASALVTRNVRSKIKQLILEGNIDQAIECIKTVFPAILDIDNQLHFKLLRQHLIEMFRRRLLLDIKHEDDSQRVFLSMVMSFVHTRVLSTVATSQVLFQELELTMSLLCFNLDSTDSTDTNFLNLPPELKKLFHESHRNDCFSKVNAAITKCTQYFGRGVPFDNNTPFKIFFGTGSLYDGQEMEYIGPSYGVGFETYDIENDEALAEPLELNNTDPLEYKVGLPQSLIKTSGLDRVKHSLEFPGRIFGISYSKTNEKEIPHDTCTSGLENILQLWQTTVETLNKSRQRDSAIDE